MRRIWRLPETQESTQERPPCCPRCGSKRIYRHSRLRRRLIDPKEGERAARGDEVGLPRRAAHPERQRPQCQHNEETDARDPDGLFQVTGFRAEVASEIFEEFLDAHAQAVVALGLPARAQRGRQQPGFGLAVLP